MSRMLYDLNNEQYEKNNWTEVHTMKWKKVSPSINLFLNAADLAYRYFPSTDEEVLSNFHRLLLKECRDDIVKVNAIIDDAKLIITSYQSNGLAITYLKNKSQRHNSIVSKIYSVSQNEFTKYGYNADILIRGRAATYRHNFEIFREDVKDSIFFTKIDSSMEEKINQEKYDIDYQSRLGTLGRKRDNMRRDLNRRMSKEVIIKKTQETLYDLARGRGTSSLGAFSFDINAHLYFIERETGNLVDLNSERFPHPTQHYEFKSVLPLKPEHKIVLDDLSNEINTMLVDLHDASKDWYEVMSTINELLEIQSRIRSRL